jgi:hypothetical protein
VPPAPIIKYFIKNLPAAAHGPTRRTGSLSKQERTCQYAENNFNTNIEKKQRKVKKILCGEIIHSLSPPHEYMRQERRGVPEYEAKVTNDRICDKIDSASAFLPRRAHISYNSKVTGIAR